MTEDKGCAECTDWGNGNCTSGCFLGRCRNCDCPWNSCLIHTEFCCDACSHPDGPR